MEIIIVKRDSTEWNNMWDILSAHPLNVDYPDPSVVLHDGESWQYMGSFKQGDKVIHEFRHRFHPRFQRKEYIKFKGSENITDDDIEMTKPVK